MSSAARWGRGWSGRRSDGTVQRSRGSSRVRKSQVCASVPVKSMPNPGTGGAVVDRAADLEREISALSRPIALLLEGKVASELTTIARLIRKRAPDVARVGLESGSMSVWLTHALKAGSFPVVCLDARHAHAVLSVRPNRSCRAVPAAGTLVRPQSSRISEQDHLLIAADQSPGPSTPAAPGPPLPCRYADD